MATLEKNVGFIQEVKIVKDKESEGKATTLSNLENVLQKQV